MTINELKDKLYLLNVRPQQYSLNGESKPDATIIQHFSNVWQVYYLDERGEKHREKEFSSEDDACKYVYDLFKRMKETEQRFGLNE